MSQIHVLSGFVVGTKLVNNNKEVWIVRVDDKSSKEDQQKFEVATTKVELLKGLLVEFMLGTILVGEKKVRKAIEVMAKNT